MNPNRLIQHFHEIAEAPDAIVRLRRFVLDLAVRGKLVEQDPQDVPAEEILEQIKIARQSIPLGSGRRERTAQAGSDSPALGFETPKHWVSAKLGVLTSKLGAGSTPLGGKTVYTADGIPFLRSQNIYNDGLRLDHVVRIPVKVHEKMSGTHVCQGDLLLNITGASIGRCAVVPDDFLHGNVSQHVAIIRLYYPAIRSFMHLLLISPPYQEKIMHVQVGVSREGLSMQSLKEFAMALPPLAEQNRIVAKVDELMAICDELEAAQTKREQRRDRLVAATLHSLSNGSNTAQGDQTGSTGPGAKHQTQLGIPQASTDHPQDLTPSRSCPDLSPQSSQPIAEPTAFYLRHLPRLTTKPEHIKQLRQTILNLAIQGKLVPQDPNDEPADEGDDTDFRTLGPTFFIPPSWRWCRLSRIGPLSGGGTPSKANQSYWGGSVPWVSPKDMKSDRLSCTILSITEEAIPHSATRMIPTGSLLFVVRGMILAHSFPVAINEVPVTINQDMKALSPYEPEMSEYLLVALKGLKYSILRKVQRSTHGTCRIEGVDYANLPIPVPPIAEQRRIVAKVNALMTLCDELEASIATATTTRTALLESILKEALRQSG